MLTKFLTKLFGTKIERTFKAYLPYTTKINQEYAQLQNLSNDALRDKIQPIQQHLQKELANMTGRIASLNEKIATNTSSDVEEREHLFKVLERFQGYYNEDLEAALNDVLPKAFAIIKETAHRFKEQKQLIVTANDFDKAIAARSNYVEIKQDKAIWHNQWDVMGLQVVWDMCHYDVQLIGGVILHQGKIAEMATGEGKTLAATLPAFLNALAGKGVHIVTVNDYLAKRDAAWMGPIFEFHGLKVDCIDKHPPHSKARQEAYRAAIIYGTNNEFGFDYLRDNLVNSPEELVQQAHHFAIVDEVDSVLIDDARTPLIISGPTEKETNEQEYLQLKPKVEQLYQAQKQLTTQFLQEAKNKIKEGNTKEGGLALFRAYRGLPKYKPLIKYLSETGIRKLLEKTENYYMQDNASMMPEADEPLLFTIDEQHNSVDITERGLQYITQAGQDPSFFILPDVGLETAQIENNPALSNRDKIAKQAALKQDYITKSQRIHITQQLLKAYTLFEKDVDYIVSDKKVKIINEQTGRILEGRRYADGLHQAIEAKENVPIEKPSQTYATITLQNYFRMYHKLAGMTGTAETDSAEFFNIYNLDVKVVPTHKPTIREDKNDKVYKTVREKFKAIIEEITALSQQKRPVLIGTTSVEISELVSRMLSLQKIKHQILNAKNHQKEATIIAEAGKAGTVTIATNMAGRGTDIKLTSEAKAAGGLAIIGTERHESRRVDRQLCGRAGRQGDPGSSQFFVSLEDNLMRLFGSGRIAAIMDKLGLKEGEVIQHTMISKSIEKAQKKVERNNFGIRRRLLEYDDVMNKQRAAIYQRRKNALFGKHLDVDIMSMLYILLEHKLINENRGCDHEILGEFLAEKFSVGNLLSYEEFKVLGKAARTNIVYKRLLALYRRRGELHQDRCAYMLHNLYSSKTTPIAHVAIPFFDGKTELTVVVNFQDCLLPNEETLVKNFEKVVFLTFIDQYWKEHLRELDGLKQSVQNAVYEQQDPLLNYKFEGYRLFKSLLEKINQTILDYLFKATIHPYKYPVVLETVPQRERSNLQENKQTITTLTDKNNPLKTSTQTLKSQKIAARNQRVTVRYNDGTLKKDIKFKIVEEDIANKHCILIEEKA